MSSAVRIAVLLLVACLLTGCGDDTKDPGSDPSRTPSPSTSGPAPATGLLIERPTFGFHLPEGWKENDPITVGSSTLTGGRPVEGWDFTDLTVETWTKKNFHDVSKLSGDVLENFRVAVPKGKLVGLSEWAGQPAYHMTGTGSVAGYGEQFGVIWKDQHIVIRFDFVSPQAAGGFRPEYELTKAQRQAVMDSVEASWEWR